MIGVLNGCRRFVQTLFQDFRIGIRITARDRYSSLLMIGSLGLAIGACAVVFSLIDAVLYRPLPAVSDPSALFAIYGDDRSTAKIDYQSVAYPDYLDFKESLHNSSDLTVYARLPITLASAEEAQRVTGELVAPNYFSLLGVRPQLGRALEAEDDAGGAVPAVVISDRLWQARFGGARDVLGKVIRINELEARIVGVTPAEFGGVLLDWYGRADIWLPLGLEPRLWRMDLLSLRVPWLMCLGRLHAGASLEQVRVAVQARARDLERTHVDTNQNRGAVVIRADEARFYPGRRKAVTSVLSFLFAGSLVLLLVACFNTTALLLARGEKRGSELSVRMALGAKRSRLVGQLIAESLIIAAAADAVAVLCAALATRHLPSVAPIFHLDFETRLDARVAVVLAFIALLTILAVGLYPAIRASSVSLAGSLKTRSVGQAGTFGVRRAVIVVQVSLAVVVLTSGALFLKQLRQLGSINPGFDIHGVQVIRLDSQSLPPDQREVARAQLLQFVRTVPGVREASLAGQEPLGGSMKQIRVRAETPLGERRMAFEEVSKDYFQVLRLPLLQGRTFGGEDHSREVIVNQVMAAQYWPGQSPVGQRLTLGEEETPYVIVGVAKASKTIDLNEQPRPFLYLPLARSSVPEIVLLARSSLPLAELVRFVRGELGQDMRGVALLNSSTLEQVVAARLSVERTLAVWTLGVAALALFLVIAGLIGALSLFVTQRSRDIAIRLALGASPYDLSGWVVSRGLLLGSTGVLLGFALFLGLKPFLSSYLTVNTSSQPVIYLIVVGFILATCGLACLAPALRVLRIEPGRVLRAE